MSFKIEKGIKPTSNQHENSKTDWNAIRSTVATMDIEDSILLDIPRKDGGSLGESRSLFRACIQASVERKLGVKLRAETYPNWTMRIWLKERIG